MSSLEFEGAVDQADRPSVAPPVPETASSVIATIGQNIRRRRMELGLTLQAIADRSGISTSMLSLIERGKSSPSIGSLVAIASSLDTQTSELISSSRASDQVVSRVADQRVHDSAEGVTRRILKVDQDHAIELAISDFEPGTASAPTAVRHDGYEFGVVLDGILTVNLGRQTYRLNPGDLISYPSTQLHRIANNETGRARALWINLLKE